MIATLNPSDDEITKEGWIPIETIERPKAGGNRAQMEQLLTSIQKSYSGKRIGVLTKDVFSGEFYTEWNNLLKGNELQSVDVAIGISVSLSIKDEASLKFVRKAAEVTNLAMNRFFIREMEAIIDEEREMTHTKLADTMEAMLLDEEQLRKRLKLPSDVNGEFLDWCYSPIIQSGGKYDLKPSATSNDTPMHFGTILCSLGVRYHNWCSNVARTFMIEPTKEQEANYLLLVELEETLMRSMRPGMSFADVYDRAVQWIHKRRPELEPHFLKNCGFSMGIEYRESHYVLNSKNKRELKNGMIINLVLGFQDLENKDASDAAGKTYSLLLADTIEVRHDESVFLTSVSRSFDNIAYFFKGDGEETNENTNDTKVALEDVANQLTREKGNEQEAPARRHAAAATAVSIESQSSELRRKAHQKELQHRVLEQGERRFQTSGGKVNQAPNDAAARLRQIESYKTPLQLPKEALRRPKIYIDRQRDAVILPIYGTFVPFHISTIKNVSKNEEGDFVYLRINFVSPGQVFGKKTDMGLVFDNPNATFVREVSYRSGDSRNLNEAFRLIQELRKRVREREAEKLEKADLVEQGELTIVKGRPVPRLSDVAMRPALTASKKVTGSLEAHSNGLRYTTMKGERVDVLYSNIKHLFFQPCDNEMIVLLHCSLHCPILIGKKKTYDVQFYREVSDSMVEETGARRRANFFDRDELEEEQEERRRRKSMNKEFKLFSEKIMELNPSLEVDVPFRDLGFLGVPFRSTVFLQPTTDCLVQLSEPPFLVLTLSEVEIAHFERVQFGLKNFDLVFIYKDFNKPVLQINSIPMNYLENIKDWLDSVDIAYSEGTANLNWSAIMKHVVSDPAAFYAEGGWSFIQNSSENEGEGGGDEDDETGSEFAPSDDDGDFAGEKSENDNDDSDDEDDDDDDDSEFDEDEELEEDEEDEDASADDEEIEEGMDWSDLEEEAAREDRKRHHHSDDDEDDNSRKKHTKVLKVRK